MVHKTQSPFQGVWGSKTYCETNSSIVHITKSPFQGVWGSIHTVKQTHPWYTKQKASLKGFGVQYMQLYKHIHSTYIKKPNSRELDFIFDLWCLT